ncbi:hypothetical protein [Methylomonas sp. TEB]|uniref:hypothetical protein n=1 Tax=Methylomonas sp. TEB TaxID=3398229 RepID=UPI0039F4F96C
MPRPLLAFYTVCLILAFLVSALTGQAQAAAFVTVTPNSASSVGFLDLKAWDKALNPSAWQVASSGGSAVVTAPRPASLQTLLNKVVPLPANWSAAIPRQTLAASAANIAKKAGGYGLAAYAIYSVVSPLIGLNPDGTVTETGTPTTTYSDTSGVGVCWINGGTNFGTIGVAACLAAIKAANPWVSSWCSYDATRMATKSATGGCSIANGYMNKSVVQCTAPAVPDYSTGQCATTTTPTTITTPTESQLASKIQASSATESQLADAVIRDSIAKNIDFGSSGFMTPTTPVTVSASPVSGPEETISTAQVPNADGTTSTVTKKSITTATPTVTGTTVGDTNISWATSTTEITTTTNNTTNVTTTTTVINNDGTSTTQKQNDYGTFTGSDPGDGFADGKAIIASYLCGGNCSSSINCAMGVCSPGERFTTLKNRAVPSITSAGTCPAFVMDLSSMGLGVINESGHCDLLESNRSNVATIVNLLIMITVSFIVLKA